jgi:hypothetical protein
MDTFVKGAERSLKARTEDEQAVHEAEVRELRAKTHRQGFEQMIRAFLLATAIGDRLKPRRERSAFERADGIVVVGRGPDNRPPPWGEERAEMLGARPPALTARLATTPRRGCRLPPVCPAGLPARRRSVATAPTADGSPTRPRAGASTERTAASQPVCGSGPLVVEKIELD